MGRGRGWSGWEKFVERFKTKIVTFSKYIESHRRCKKKDLKIPPLWRFNGVS